MVPWRPRADGGTSGEDQTGLKLLVKTFALATLMSALGCQDVGTVVFVVEAPSAPELDPRPAARTVELITARDGLPPVVARVSVAGSMSALPVGNIPLGDAVSFELRGFSDGNQVVAYGRTGPIRIEASGETRVTIPVRRPFAYVAGKFFPAVMTGTTKLYDTASVLQASTPEIPLTGWVPVGVAVSTDGRELLVGASRGGTMGQVVLIDTLSHGEQKVAALAAAPNAVALGPRGEVGAVVHTDANKVSILSLPVIRSNPTEPLGAVRAVDNVRQPGALAMTDNTAFVLAGRPTSLRCGSTPAPPRSAVVEVDLLTATAMPERDLGFPARDIAVDPRNGRVIVTDTCGGKVVALAPGATTGDKLIDMSGPRALAVVRRKLVAAGGTTTQPATVTLAVADLDAPQSPPSAFTIKMPDERIEIPIDNTPGQSVEIRIAPDLVEPLDIAVTQDGSRAVILVHSVHRQESIPLIAPGATLDSYYVLLVELETGTVLSRVRSSCAALQDGDPDLYFCGDSDSVEPASLYVPSSVAVVWGSP